MQIIVKGRGSEKERRKSEDCAAILKRYYAREIRDGSRIKLPAKKEVIKELYAQR